MFIQRTRFSKLTIFQKIHQIEKWPGAADDILTRVPLYASIPTGGKKGHVVKTQVQTADILETMLDLANVQSDFVRFGQSLRSLLERGIQGDEERCVFSEGGLFFRSELFPGGSDHVPDDPRGMYWPRAFIFSMIPHFSHILFS